MFVLLVRVELLLTSLSLATSRLYYWNILSFSAVLEVVPLLPSNTLNLLDLHLDLQNALSAKHLYLHLEHEDD